MIIASTLFASTFVFSQNKKSKTTPPTASQLRLDSLRTALKAQRDSAAAAREMATENRRLQQEEQQFLREQKRRKVVPPITQEMNAGYRLYSNGWGIYSQRGFIRTEDPEHVHTNFLWVELSEIRSPNEYRLQNQSFSSLNPNEPKPLPYKYGKINNFYQLKIGYGNQKPISGKPDLKSIQINWVYAAAFSLGMLKPYYLDLLIPEGNGFVRRYDRYSDDTRESFLDLRNQGTIIGGADFTKGISEINMKPGIALRSGFYFDYTFSRKSFVGAEIGLCAEAYSSAIPIMAQNQARSFFLSLYADIRMGKRWE